MTLEVDISDTVDENYWNKNLRKNTCSTIYQVPNYSIVYKQVFDSKPIFITVKKNSELAGQLAILIHTKYYWKDANVFSKTLGSKLNLNSILRWEYGPIIHDSFDKGEILEALLMAVERISEENNVNMVRGTTYPLPIFDYSKIFAKHGYNYTSWATYITELEQDPESLYDKLSKETRYDIRKSEKHELELEIVDSLSSFKEYSDLAFSSRIHAGEKRRNNPLFVEKFWENLYNKGYLQVFLARKNGELLGAIENLVFNKNIIQYGVVNSPKIHLLGGTFLTWNAIKWSIENHYSTYDMGGINPAPKIEKEKSINFYKSKWGGKQLDYGRYIKIRKLGKTQFAAALSDPKKVSTKIKKFFQ
ncbi:MAG: hypothetical protein AUI61_01710 [Thaumarchaeota archaeon 13_1_40CM_2_39_13_2]|nr:MAG: hypothetical protein AUI92_08265 [Thaumarchaeota archaeon 13_1_40CM_3_38_6]OLD32995.1 MAG: hypothetical protein AUI61_01710 [Thaumarchaeota archaeon 13_1_40CM_2_39_13_2]OLE40361.1 MAG: hypothetical protein AUG16_04285 [Thaumarchaeota archaeon 13_1_20CM_2_39_20]